MGWAYGGRAWEADGGEVKFGVKQQGGERCHEGRMSEDAEAMREQIESEQPESTPQRQGRENSVKASLITLHHSLIDNRSHRSTA